MNEADARATLRSQVAVILSSNKWQPRFNFTIENSIELAADIADSIFDNNKHCFREREREWPPKDDKEVHLKHKKGFG